jgi:hypothetical protein
MLYAIIKSSYKKSIFELWFFEKLFFILNLYLIDIKLFDMVCVLFFLLSPKTIPKTRPEMTFLLGLGLVYRAKLNEDGL